MSPRAPSAASAVKVWASNARTGPGSARNVASEPGDKVATCTEHAMEAAVEIGIRELRDHLSQYLKHVESGEEVVVTDHGRAVARVVPINGTPMIDRLIAEGLVTPAVLRKGRAQRPVKVAGNVSELLAEQRR